VKRLALILAIAGVTGLILGGWQATWYPIPPLSLTLEGQSINTGWLITGTVILVGILLYIRDRRQRR